MTTPTDGMALPSATIVMTTHNRPELVKRALASALGQIGVDLRVVMVDDGSEPPFEPAVDDDRLTLLRNDSPRGPSAARNQGLARASGDWVSFLDDDDVLRPNMLRSSIEAARSSALPKPVSAMSGAEIVSPDGTVIAVRMPPTLRKGKHYFLEDVDTGASFQTHATLVAPLEVVKELDGFDAELPASEHDDFFIRLNAASSIQGLSEVTYQITAHTGQRLSKAVLERARGMELTVAKHETTFSRHPRRYGHYLATIGVTYLRGGKWWPAVKATTKALVVDPRRPRTYLWWLAALAGPWPLRVRRRIRRRRAS